MTTTAHRLLAALLLLGGLLAIPPSARAAESYDACVDYIGSLPATINTQGVWCLDKNLATNITTGNAITIATNNVTIDCNGFKIGGLAAGNGSQANGIRADGKQNATVRNCNIRGFRQGIYLNGGAGHLVEDNRLDNNLEVAILVYGSDNSRVRRNAAYDTGGATGKPNTWGIFASADIVGNTVSGLYADVPNGNMRGIYASGYGTQVRDNTVSGFDMTAIQGGNVANAYGITAYEDQQRVSGNHVAGDSGNITGTGITTINNAATTYCLDNTVVGFTATIDVDCISNDNVAY